LRWTLVALCTYHVYKDLGSNAKEILRISSGVRNAVMFTLLMERIIKCAIEMGSGWREIHAMNDP
jgi:hypothetical protein